jgi:rfaE bifunctional protein nucleotidyltransferase chain/domain
MTAEKIKTLSELKKIVAEEKAGGKKVVFTNGCFDLLHPGHIRYLEEARDKGDLLIVAVNSDDSVRRIKGPSRPVTRESDRAEVLAGLASVDYVVIFSEADPARVIKELTPDVLVKGGDWEKKDIIGREWVEGHGGRVETVPFAPGYSTTSLLESIAGRFR